MIRIQICNILFSLTALSIMILSSFLFIGALAPLAFGCPDHSNNKRSHLRGRQAAQEINATQPATAWAYEASYNWGKLSPSYRLCQTGTQQSPIALSLGNGLSLNHVPTFNYTGISTGNFFNWKYGPAMTLAHDGDWTHHPSFTYDDQTLYLKGWHIHAPADHSVGGDRSKAEMHFVHVDATGHEAAVLAFRLDPGNFNSTFFAQLPSMIGFEDIDVEEAVEMDLGLALEAVQYFNEFWTYCGSLTSPPCHEGIRWFVARQIMFTGVEQMQAILGASTYSARAEQEVWQHRINE
jgi:carbonic anhydrase